jgi:hypothetical protein
MFPALDAKAAGYRVYVVMDASGDPSELASRTTLARFAQAGIVPTSANADLDQLRREGKARSHEYRARYSGRRDPYASLRTGPAAYWSSHGIPNPTVSFVMVTERSSCTETQLAATPG